MRADDVPPCLVDLPSLPSIEWPMLLARLSHWGELLVDRQPALMGDGAALTAFEFELENDLIDLLRSQFGDVSVLAEETFHRTGQAVGTPGPLRLVLDPVDGSRSYADGSGIYAITLAAFLDDRPLFGIVHHPVDQITYAAARGRGAYRGTQRLKPSHTAPRRVAIRQRGMTAPVADAAELLSARGYVIEGMACTSLKLCWIADGRIAGVVKPVTERNGILSTWGLTAGQLVAEETGYLVTALDGSPWRWQPGEVAIGDAGFRSALNLH
jgi:myo-inositol-1(or 4)-monophosphatase